MARELRHHVRTQGRSSPFFDTVTACPVPPIDVGPIDMGASGSDIADGSPPQWGLAVPAEPSTSSPCSSNASGAEWNAESLIGVSTSGGSPVDVPCVECSVL
eukprot:355754-Chlamydomonas_euryale.AAC.21